MARNEARIQLREKIAGSLYGMLCGDALGCPVEGYPPQTIREVYGRVTQMVEPVECWRPPGLHSDDSQQAMALCDALLKSPMCPEQELGAIWVQMLSAPSNGASLGAHRGVGGNFVRTLVALKGEAGPYEGAQPSSGNGVAMMIAPTAWYHRERTALLQDVVLRAGRVKQKDVRGLAAASAVAYVVAYALEQNTFAQLDVRAFLGFVGTFERAAAEVLHTDEHVHTFSGALSEMLRHLGQEREKVLSQIAECASRTAGGRCYATSAYTPASVITSIYLALTSRSYEQAVADAVNLGGDADTTGAMVGAMAGALYGRGAIPKSWAQALVAWGAFDDRLEPLLDRAQGWSPEVLLAEVESGWTRMLIQEENAAPSWPVRTVSRPVLSRI